MRKKIVAGNWKMNKRFEEADELLGELADKMESLDEDVDVIVCPPFLYTEMALDYAQIEDEDDKDATYSIFSVGCQDVSTHSNGAYTGEVSAEMMADMGVEYCIVGHSERRKYFGETNQDVAQKIEALLSHNIIPIVCVGESLQEREAGTHLELIKKQVEEALFGLSPLDFLKIVIAYEPIWAIGTGKTATPDQAQEIHAFIRSLVQEKYGKETAKNLSILYGGSCNANNARELFAKEDVDGGLIGGASLNADDFIKIIKSF